MFHPVDPVHPVEDSDRPEESPPRPLRLERNSDRRLAARQLVLIEQPQGVDDRFDVPLVQAFARGSSGEIEEGVVEPLPNAIDWNISLDRLQHQDERAAAAALVSNHAPGARLGVGDQSQNASPALQFRRTNATSERAIVGVLLAMLFEVIQ
jgi:hypothetical protein